MHMYTNQEAFPGHKDSSNALTPKQINKLKGRDLMLASAAASFGVDVFLVPYLSHDCQGDMSDLRLSKFPKKKKCPRYMSEDDVETFFDGDCPKETDEYMGDPVDNDADVYGSWSMGARSKQKTQWEARTTTTSKSNLFLQVPEYSENRGQCTQEMASKPVAKKAKAL